MISGHAVLTPSGLRLGNRTLPCSIGRGGITTDKREGDMATPAGVLHVTGCLYRPDRLRAPAPWAVPIRVGDLWSDDPRDPAYNHFARAPHAFSHENLRRCDPLYDIVVLTDWNWPDAQPGRGSAIFFHQWRAPRYPTAGCLAFSRSGLRWLAGQLPPGSKVVIPRGARGF